ncbi:class I SAM-dependent methyltransferase [Patescibacteria group bacterium]|nr:class I SAM-dependent methyltransferase [Patescibacteria group bacterium]
MKEKLNLKKGGKLVDLGCGDGKALRFFYTTFKVKCEGYDFNPFALQWGRFLNRYHRISDIKMIRSSFEVADLKKYDYIYTYLFPNQLMEIEKRIFTNIKKDAIIISNSFKFAKHKPFSTIKNNKGRDTIFLYKKS